MYTITHKTEENIIEVKNTNNSVFGKIYLNLGASLQELTIKGEKIIQDLSPLPYKTTYASSILFPFANRVKDGKYSFNNEEFQLEVNQKEENNALHGFVYNKIFKIIDEKVTENSAKVTLEYIENIKTAGFPYTYLIQISYLFTKDTISLTINIKNTDTKVFPFTVGWHPYFISENLAESLLNFDCKQKLIIGNRNITEGKKDIESKTTLRIGKTQLDDCWILNSDKVQFKTPKYQLEFESSVPENFLQAYTPPRENTIAIEPTTGVSNSFNNNIGIQTLNPNKIYKINWKIKLVKLL